MFGWNYGLWDLNGPDEGRYVQISKELLGRSNWLKLTVHGEPYDQKPPLAYWFMALALKLNDGEVSAWAARLPSVLFGVLAVCLTYLIGKQRLGHRAGIVAGCVLLTSPMFISQTTTAKLDIMLTGWTMLAAWAYLSREEGKSLSTKHAILFWCGLIGGFFTKGPTIFLPIMGLILGDAWRNGFRKSVVGLRARWGLSAFIGLVVAWLYSQWLWAGAGFVEGQVSQGFWGRIFKSDHANPIWYYALHLFTDNFMPWTLLLVAAWVTAWRSRKSDPNPALTAIHGWAVVPLLFFHVMLGKREAYLLPILPALALTVGWYVDRHFLKFRLPAWSRRTFVLTTCLLAVAVVSGAIAALLEPDLFWDREFYVEDIEAFALIGFGLLIGVIAYANARIFNTKRLVISVLALALIVGAANNAVINPALNIRNSSFLLSHEIERHLPDDHATIGACGKAADSRYHVYGSYSVAELPDSVPKLLAESELPDLIVLREKDAVRLEPTLAEKGFVHVDDVMADSFELALLSRLILVEPQLKDPLIVAALGDTGEGDSHQERVGIEMAKLNAEKPLAAIFHLGDVLYGDEPFKKAMYSRFIEPYNDLLKSRVPFYGALGNHDVKTPQRRKEILKTRLLGMEGRPYYRKVLTTDTVSATFFILDSNAIRNDPQQVAWFREEMASCRSTWRIVILHHPMDASEIGHGPEPSIYDLIEETLVGESGEPGAHLILTGHNHVYERRVVRDGIQHVTIGNGGALSGSSKFPDDPGRAVGYNDASCFSWMEISAESIRFRAINEYGEEVDDFILKQKPANTGVIAEAPPSDEAGTFTRRQTMAAISAGVLAGTAGR